MSSVWTEMGRHHHDQAESMHKAPNHIYALPLRTQIDGLIKMPLFPSLMNHDAKSQSNHSILLLWIPVRALDRGVWLTLQHRSTSYGTDAWNCSYLLCIINSSLSFNSPA